MYNDWGGRDVNWGEMSGSPMIEQLSVDYKVWYLSADSWFGFDLKKRYLAECRCISNIVDFYMNMHSSIINHMIIVLISILGEEAFMAITYRDIAPPWRYFQEQ